MKHSNIPNNFAITSILETKPNPELHVAIIMDGNGRWATHRGLPRPAGHAAGVKALRSVTAAAPALRISTLTVYAFSSDNWRRPQAEVSALMGLLQTYLKKDVCNLVRQGVRLQVIGRVILPLAAPGIVTAGIFCFIIAWNEFLFALILTTNEAVTLPVGLALFKAEEGELWHYIAAAGILIMVPMWVLALLIQKHFVQGMTMGAVK